jgi:DNA-binding GntR family transcriptional regulator
MNMGRRDLSKIAYDYLYEQIISNKYPPETAIVENDVCNVLNMSRTPVREALKRLELEGLVYKIKDVGTVVRDITYDDIREVFEIRSMIELYALKDYINRITDVEIKKLLAMFEVLSPESSPQEYYNADRMFHNSLLSYSSNSRLILFWKQINSHVEKFRRISGATPRRLNYSKEEHLACLYAIRDRNYEKAYQNLAYHLEEVKKNTIEAKRNSYMYL